MDNNSLAVVAVAALCAFVLILIVALIVKQRVSGSVKVSGVEMKVDAEDTANAKRLPKARAGIIGNLSIGKTRIETKGSGLVADNRSIGDTEISADSQPSTPPAAKPPSNHK